MSFPELAADLPRIREAMAQAQVTRALCICTTLEEFTAVAALADQHDDFWATVGVHPDNEGVTEPSVADLIERAAHPKVVGIGETGLDYYQMEQRKGGRSVADMEWQRNRFRVHIRAARQVRRPLIIHTREAADDTIAI
ncbi:MAG: TatD family hydrolase, partial [Chromatiaceae bacterium]|nr:TatD family hydrolase [Chromatiaceae bacterium]